MRQCFLSSATHTFSADALLLSSSSLTRFWGYFSMLLIFNHVSPSYHLFSLHFRSSGTDIKTLSHFLFFLILFIRLPLGIICMSIPWSLWCSRHRLSLPVALLCEQNDQQSWIRSYHPQCFFIWQFITQSFDNIRRNISCMYGC